MNCAYSSKKGNCIGCSLTNHCPIYKEWRRLTEIGFKENRTDELIDLVKEVVGIINIVKDVDLKNKQNQEQLFEKISKIQDKLSELKQE